MHLLIPAAGMGKRMQSDRNKLLLSLADRPLLYWTLRAAAAAESISWIGIIAQPTDWQDIQEIVRSIEFSKPVAQIVGGATRQESVYNGLQGLPDTATHVLIHDGARCLATPSLFDRTAVALATTQGLIAAIPVKDTIKVVDGEMIVTNTPDRDFLWAAQTPQGFDVSILKACHDRGKQEGWEVTDDATLFEKCGYPVKIVPGEETNLKITTPVDLAIAHFILASRSDGAAS